MQDLPMEGDKYQADYGEQMNSFKRNLKLQDPRLAHILPSLQADYDSDCDKKKPLLFDDENDVQVIQPLKLPKLDDKIGGS